jgi:hypothetical protein
MTQKTKTVTQQIQTTTNTNKSTTHADFHGDVNAARLKAVTNPGVRNPLTFTDPTDRQAATLSRIQRIVENPNYKKLNGEQQTHLRSRFYDKYVAPGYSKQGYAAPDKATWIAGVTQKNNATGGFMFNPSDYYEGQNRDDASRIGFAAAKNVGDILHGMLSAGVWVGKEASLSQLGLKDYFTHPSPQQQASARQGVDNAAKYAQKVVDRISTDTIENSNFWMQTHPSKSFAAKADSILGEALVQMPLYMAIGNARALGETKNLTAAMAKAGPAAKIVASALGGATDAFIGSVVQGQSKEETSSNMASFMGFSAFGETVSVAGSALIKKITAHTLAAGGRPLQEAITTEAEHELINGTHTNLGDISKAHDVDPLKTKLVSAEKISLNSIAMQKFGKPLRNLSQQQRLSVRQSRAELASDAVREMPLHMPEVAKANAQAAVRESRELDPEMAAWDAQMAQKHGVNFEKSLHEAELTSTAEQTGVKSAQGTTSKVAKATEKVNKGNQNRLEKAQEEEPRKFAQMKVDHLAYFKNPSPGAKKGFDYRNWLDGMESKDFLDELKSHVGNEWFFEKPQHLLEYALSYRKELPSVFAGRIVQELEDIDPEGDVNKWYASAVKRDKHLENMAATGRLWSEGNIFRSSRFAQGSRATKWQAQLNKEAQAIKKNEKNNLKAKMKPTQTHYQGADTIAQSILDKLQKGSE